MDEAAAGGAKGEKRCALRFIPHDPCPQQRGSCLPELRTLPKAGAAGGE